MPGLQRHRFDVTERFGFPAPFLRCYLMDHGFCLLRPNSSRVISPPFYFIALYAFCPLSGPQITAR